MTEETQYDLLTFNARKSKVLVKNDYGVLVFEVDGRQAGTMVEGSGVFVTRRTPLHYMRKFRGFGLSKSVMDELLRRGCVTVRIVFVGTDLSARYEAPLVAFYSSSKRHVFREGDSQHFLCVDDMVAV